MRNQGQNQKRGIEFGRWNAECGIKGRTKKEVLNSEWGMRKAELRAETKKEIMKAELRLENNPAPYAL